MCGLVTIYSYAPRAKAVDRSELRAVRDHMRRRGPDGSGEWFDPSGRVAMGHRRLSIIDLSNAGSQPMHGSDGRYTIVFNGEIYNHRELRAELETQGAKFASQSDTEVLIHGFAHWGEGMLHRLRGMFAFALWDAGLRRLFLARDPLGIKPLYYSDEEGVLRVASQVKALLAGGGVGRQPNPAGAVGFFLWGSVPEPHTLFKAIRAFPAGSYQYVDEKGPAPVVEYWSPRRMFEAALAAPPPPGEPEALARVAITQCVRHHLEADVPVGVFLSNGVDSNTIMAVVARAQVKDIAAFTLGFHEFKGTQDDETIWAARTAQRCGAKHYVGYISEEDFVREMPVFLEVMDQPTIDGINTYMVSRLAANHGYKVALTGLGGDELFGGYKTFDSVPKWIRHAAWLAKPPLLRELLGMIAGGLPGRFKPHKVAALARYGHTYPGAYFVTRGFMMPDELPAVLGAEMAREGLRAYEPAADASGKMPRTANGYALLAAAEQSLYMRNMLLRDADWAGMAHSLEIRTPLVDSQLYEAIVPLRLRAAAGKHPKHLLAGAGESPIMADILGRRKTGFSVPMARWLDAAGIAGQGEPWNRRWAREVYGHAYPGTRLLPLAA